MYGWFYEVDDKILAVYRYAKVPGIVESIMEPTITVAGRQFWPEETE